MFGFKQLIIVAIGGGIGSMLRYKLGGFALHHTQTWNFPVSTFSINVAGCLAIGVVAALIWREHARLY